MNKAATTRRNILEQSFRLIYAKGYQTTSIDDILATTSLTKGAFYYHFKNKDEMGLAIIEELLKPVMYKNYVEVLEQSSDPISDIYQMMQQLLLDDSFLLQEYGCPAANFTHEMAPWNTAFSKTLQELIATQEEAMKYAIDKGKRTGKIRKDVKAEQVWLFVMSGYWGVRNFGKLHADNNCYKIYLKELKNYLNTLK